MKKQREKAVREFLGSFISSKAANDMKHILQKDELIKHIDTCLQMTSLPRDIYEPYMARPFETSGF
ncbi:hypothetical protein ACEQPO_21275 [Bacillus sp. SL00103]